LALSDGRARSATLVTVGPSVWDRTGNERLTLADLQVTCMKRGAAEKPPDIGRIPT